MKSKEWLFSRLHNNIFALPDNVRIRTRKTAAVTEISDLAKLSEFHAWSLRIESCNWRHLDDVSSELRRSGDPVFGGHGRCPSECLALSTPVLKAAKEIIIFETVGTLVIVAVQKLDSKASRFAPNASLYNINLCPHFISYHQEEKKLLGHVSCA